MFRGRKGGGGNRLREREGLMGMAVGRGGSEGSAAPPTPAAAAATEMRRPSRTPWEDQQEEEAPAPVTECAQDATRAQLQSITGRMFQVNIIGTS